MFKPIMIEPTERLQKLPPYLFAEIDRKKRELVSKGKDVIDLGVGDPDIPTPDFIVTALQHAAANPRNHRYALDQGMPEFRARNQRRFLFSLPSLAHGPVACPGRPAILSRPLAGKQALALCRLPAPAIMALLRAA